MRHASLFLGAVVLSFFCLHPLGALAVDTFPPESEWGLYLTPDEKSDVLANQRGAGFLDNNRIGDLENRLRNRIPLSETMKNLEEQATQIYERIARQEEILRKKEYLIKRQKALDSNMRSLIMQNKDLQALQVGENENSQRFKRRERQIEANKKTIESIANDLKLLEQEGLAIRQAQSDELKVNKELERDIVIRRDEEAKRLARKAEIAEQITDARNKKALLESQARSLSEAAQRPTKIPKNIEGAPTPRKKILDIFKRLF